MEQLQREIKDIQKMNNQLKELKKKRPDKFYEFKGMVNTVYAIKTGKEIECIL